MTPKHESFLMCLVGWLSVLFPIGIRLSWVGVLLEVASFVRRGHSCIHVFPPPRKGFWPAKPVLRVLLRMVYCSRIIEIAGGREVFSASRSKAVRKPGRAVPISRKCAPSRELTETVFSAEVHSVKTQRNIGGSVLFDDIESCGPLPTLESVSWSRDHRESIGSSPSPPSFHQTPSDFFKARHLFHIKN